MFLSMVFFFLYFGKGMSIQARQEVRTASCQWPRAKLVYFPVYMSGRLKSSPGMMDWLNFFGRSKNLLNSSIFEPGGR